MLHRDFLHWKSCGFSVRDCTVQAIVCVMLYCSILCVVNKYIYFNNVLLCLIIIIDWIYITLFPDAQNALRYEL